MKYAVSAALLAAIAVSAAGCGGGGSTTPGSVAVHQAIMSGGTQASALRVERWRISNGDPVDVVLVRARFCGTDNGFTAPKVNGRCVPQEIYFATRPGAKGGFRGLSPAWRRTAGRRGVEGASSVPHLSALSRPARPLQDPHCRRPQRGRPLRGQALRVTRDRVPRTLAGGQTARSSEHRRLGRDARSRQPSPEGAPHGIAPTGPVVALRCDVRSRRVVHGP